MAAYNQLFVYKSCYDLLLMLYRDLARLPRDIKYTLLQDLKQDTLMVLRYIYHANATQDKATYLEKALEHILNVKINIRLLWDLRQIKENSYARFLEQAENVSKQLTAWHSAAIKKQEKTEKQI